MKAPCREQKAAGDHLRHDRRLLPALPGAFPQRHHRVGFHRPGRHRRRYVFSDLQRQLYAGGDHHLRHRDRTALQERSETVQGGLIKQPSDYKTYNFLPKCDIIFWEDFFCLYIPQIKGFVMTIFFIRTNKYQ